MKKSYAELFAVLGTFTQAGISMAVSVCLCIWLASWLCDKFSLGSYVVIIGAVLGVASGFYSAVKIFKKVIFKGSKE